MFIQYFFALWSAMAQTNVSSSSAEFNRQQLRKGCLARTKQIGTVSHPKHWRSPRIIIPGFPLFKCRWRNRWCNIPGRDGSAWLAYTRSYRLVVYGRLGPSNSTGPKFGVRHSLWFCCRPLPTQSPIHNHNYWNECHNPYDRRVAPS